MLKYILLAVLIVVFAFNFKAKAIIEFVLKKEISEKQEMMAKGINYVAGLAVVILIMIFS